MTVAELLEALQGLDPTLLVLVDGYEGGLADPSLGPPETVCLNVNGSWCWGPHEEFIMANAPEAETAQAIILHRLPNPLA